MDNNILAYQATASGSPFDAIRHYRADGSEFWSARKLMKWLGYAKWQNAEKAIARAEKSLKNQGHNTAKHLTEVSKVSTDKLGTHEVKDFEVSRLGCYTIAMNADPEKEMVAQAQAYFATKTREAEVATPAQADRIQDLEKQFLPDVPLKQIHELAEMMRRFYGDAYAQRLLALNLNKFYPHLALPIAEPEEKASVSDGSALLTPTQIAEELGVNYKTGTPNPQVVNKLLEQLGYQEKIAGQWSGTAKAIELGLCDRKPVDTNSRSQKDQLLWNRKVLAILSEHVAKC